ncbi:hypothetical protein PISL3812_00857 [Talaromyces islandicus]|uniref:Uncharacterized protein n=1 Tax=Talaromyces islandicus TaxID=28573 RepID=A0A0U1LM53_TALIS|nr:hypothetical protein PISL3812_00857 [Talaromyces islandicus]
MKYLNLLSLALSGLAPLGACYQAHNFSVPIDHFHNETLYEPHTNASFNIRYWFDATHYQPGGPVFLLAGGETDASFILPVLSHGIFAELMKTYHGIGLILEHRYYGTSYPVEQITPESLRFLTTEQAMADYAYFAQHVTLPGMEAVDIRAQKNSSTPWIAYGVSYAGGFVSFLRKLYPDIYYGAISSSGTTAAITNFWKYYEPIRQYAPARCVSAIQDFVEIFDHVLIDNADNKILVAQLKNAVGAKNDSDNALFGAQLAQAVTSWQSRNWNPPNGSLYFSEYCGNATTSDHLLYPNIAPKEDFFKGVISLAGYNGSDKELVTRVLNQAGFFQNTLYKFINPQSDSSSSSSSAEVAVKKDTVLPKSDGYNWLYQQCTEWGNFHTGSGVPTNIRSIVSRVITLPYQTRTCKDFGVTSPPDTERINRYGGLNFTYPRLAAIGGFADPWRDASPLAQELYPLRNSTDDEPVIQIDLPAEDVYDGLRGAVHHWELNGATTDTFPAGLPPKGVTDAWDEIIRFVGVWLKDRY